MTDFRYLEADFSHGLPEFLAALGLADHADIGGQHLDPVFFEDPDLGHLDGRIERRLAAQGRQQGVRPLSLDDLGHVFRGDRLDIGAVGQSPGRS